jgi:hypothetical protein
VNTDIKVTMEDGDDAIYIDLWLSVNPEMRDYTFKTIAGERTENALHWIVCISTYQHGGRWEPPSVDIDEHSMHRSLGEAVSNLMALWAQNTINGAIDSMEEARQDQEDYYA